MQFTKTVATLLMKIRIKISLFSEVLKQKSQGNCCSLSKKRGPQATTPISSPKLKKKQEKKKIPFSGRNP